MIWHGSTTRGILTWGLAAALLAGCSGPYQKPLARRQIQPDATRDTRADRGSTASRFDEGREPIRPIAAAPSASTDPIAAAQMRERALAVLMSAATGETPELRANSLEALIVTPARLQTVVAPALADENAGVRGIAAMAVGKARLTGVAHLVTPLLSDPSALVRANAIYALMRCDKPVDPTPLAEMLVDANPSVRAQAAFVLGELGERSALGPLRDSARQSLTRASPGAVRLMELQIAEARAKLGDDEALVDIRTALFPARPEDLEAAALAAQIAGQIGDRGAADRLIYLTAEWDRERRPLPAEIRLAAAASLAQLGRRQGGFIADQYRKSDQDTLRAQSALVYGETGWPDNLATLSEMLSDPSGRVRVAAAAAILKITNTMALPTG